MYADDIVLIPDSEGKMKNHGFINRRNRIVNNGKSKIIVVNSRKITK